MIRPLLALTFALVALPASAQMVSEYTQYTLPDTCTRIAVSDGEGDWADFVCPGYGGYPFVLSYTDGREAITYGFATDPGMSTFGPFNYANETIEWRIAASGITERPVAAIQRWYLADQNGEWTNEILVVSRVGQPNEGGACVIGYVDPAVAGGNERAREIADQSAADFTCGADTPTIEPGIEDLVPPQG